MLCYDGIDFSEGNGINKSSAPKECNTCRYWYFLDKGFKFQLYICKWCHDVLIMSINLDEIAILSIGGADCRRNISGISKSDAVDLLQNAN